jgi:hypothetical protein
MWPPVNASTAQLQSAELRIPPQLQKGSTDRFPTQSALTSTPAFLAPPWLHSVGVGDISVWHVGAVGFPPRNGRMLMPRVAVGSMDGLIYCCQLQSLSICKILSRSSSVRSRSEKS